MQEFNRETTEKIIEQAAVQENTNANQISENTQLRDQIQKHIQEAKETVYDLKLLEIALKKAAEENANESNDEEDEQNDTHEMEVETNHNQEKENIINKIKTQLYSKAIHLLHITTNKHFSIKHKNNQDTKTLAESYNLLGEYYGAINEWQKSIEYHDQALFIYQKIEDDYAYSICLEGLAKAHTALTNWDKAISLYREANSIYQKEEEYDSAATCLQQLAALYVEQRNLHLAEETYLEALSILQKHCLSNGIDYQVSSIYKALASLNQGTRKNLFEFIAFVLSDNPDKDDYTCDKESAMFWAWCNRFLKHPEEDDIKLLDIFIQSIDFLKNSEWGTDFISEIQDNPEIKNTINQLKQKRVHLNTLFADNDNFLVAIAQNIVAMEKQLGIYNTDNATINNVTATPIVVFLQHKSEENVLKYLNMTHSHIIKDDEYENNAYDILTDVNVSTRQDLFKFFSCTLDEENQPIEFWAWCNRFLYHPESNDLPLLHHFMQFVHILKVSTNHFPLLQEIRVDFVTQFDNIINAIRNKINLTNCITNNHQIILGMASRIKQLESQLSANLPKTISNAQTEEENLLSELQSSQTPENLSDYYQKLSQLNQGSRKELFNFMSMSFNKWIQAGLANIFWSWCNKFLYHFENKDLPLLSRFIQFIELLKNSTLQTDLAKTIRKTKFESVLAALTIKMQNLEDLFDNNSTLIISMAEKINYLKLLLNPHTESSPQKRKHESNNNAEFSETASTSDAESLNKIRKRDQNSPFNNFTESTYSGVNTEVEMNPEPEIDEEAAKTLVDSWLN